MCMGCVYAYIHMWEVHMNLCVCQQVYEILVYVS